MDGRVLNKEWNKHWASGWKNKAPICKTNINPLSLSLVGNKNLPSQLKIIYSRMQICTCLYKKLRGVWQATLRRFIKRRNWDLSVAN